MKFDEVQIIDDSKTTDEFIKEIIQNRKQEDAFYVLDLGDVINKHRTWLAKIPRVNPHFAIKCNPDLSVIRTLAGLNGSFDCASKHEMEQVLSTGVSSDRIIFANTVKLPSHIKYAKEAGVNILAADNELELEKIKNIFPDAKIMIRFRCDSAAAVTTLGLKCGCDSVNEAPRIMKKAKDLGLNIHGFSFHVGSPCDEPEAWSRGIKISLALIDHAKSLGFNDVKLIDIGGGFPGEEGFPLDKYAEAINKAIDGIDPTINVISEPGRYYVGSAFTLSSLVFGKRIVDESNNISRYMYYVNDGTYGSFIEPMLNIKTRIPRPLNKLIENEKTHPSTFWGPTCDSYDCVNRDCNYPELNIGDWLVWPDMGAYTISLAGTFNGMFPSVVFPFIRQKEWDSYLDECANLRNSIAETSKN